jgi:hypothetical protein
LQEAALTVAADHLTEQDTRQLRSVFPSRSSAHLSLKREESLTNDRTDVRPEPRRLGDHEPRGLPAAAVLGP